MKYKIGQFFLFGRPLDVSWQKRQWNRICEKRKNLQFYCRFQNRTIPQLVLNNNRSRNQRVQLRNEIHVRRKLVSAWQITEGSGNVPSLWFGVASLWGETTWIKPTNIIKDHLGTGGKYKHLPPVYPARCMYFPVSPGDLHPNDLICLCQCLSWSIYILSLD